MKIEEGVRDDEDVAMICCNLTIHYSFPITPWMYCSRKRVATNE